MDDSGRLYARTSTFGDDDDRVADALCQSVKTALDAMADDSLPLENAVDCGVPCRLFQLRCLLSVQQKANVEPYFERPWVKSKRAKKAEVQNGRVAMLALFILALQGILVDRLFPQLIQGLPGYR